jgi:hypothetical protein
MNEQIELNSPRQEQFDSNKLEGLTVTPADEATWQRQIELAKTKEELDIIGRAMAQKTTVETLQDAVTGAIFDRLDVSLNQQLENQVIIPELNSLLESYKQLVEVTQIDKNESSKIDTLYFQVLDQARKIFEKFKTYDRSDNMFDRFRILALSVKDKALEEIEQTV